MRYKCLWCIITFGSLLSRINVMVNASHRYVKSTSCIATAFPSFLRSRPRNVSKKLPTDLIVESEPAHISGVNSFKRRSKGLVVIFLAAYVCVFASGPSKRKFAEKSTEGLAELEKRKSSTLPIPKIGLRKRYSKSRHLPSFPLGSLELWHRLRRRRMAQNKAMRLSIETAALVKPNKMVTRSEGTPMFRGLRFWGRAAVIYFSYKKAQLYCALALPLVDDDEREDLRHNTWEDVHARNSDRLLSLCLDLRGFYLKSGQFLGTRHDFMPAIYLEKLGRLHDAVPPIHPEKVKSVLEKELGENWKNMFSSLDLDEPLGSASISQVHKGILSSTGEIVAVKVQYPGAEKMMMSDLRNLKALASFLQRFELNFDVLSSLKELSNQIQHEFNFKYESDVMIRMKQSLASHVREGELITVPRSIMATKRVLVMSFVEGQSLASIKRGEKERFKSLRRRIGSRLLQTLADAWGYMIFGEGLFNADFHPGNIVIMPEGKAWGPTGLLLGLLGLNTPKLRVGLLDWGQVKELNIDSRTRFARLVWAISGGAGQDEIVAAFKDLGIILANPDDKESIEKLALVMFDTKLVPGSNFNPFSQENVLNLNPVRQYPQDLYFVLRAALMFRGMAQSLRVDFSLADAWAPHALKHLKDFSPKGTIYAEGNESDLLQF